jgi:putative transcriptional regulator
MKNRLKELRIAKGWSDADLALELWISAETVRAIEAGKYEPPLSLAIEIARLLGQPVEAIFLCQDQSQEGR